MRKLDDGRIGIIRKIANNSFGLNVGCGIYHFVNKINLDVTFKKAEPEILGSALRIPFVDEVFEEVMMLDVIEHVQKGSEIAALREILRVLKKGGRLLISCPNEGFMLKLLDPAYWMQGHRHYNDKEMSGMLGKAGFKTHITFLAGKLPFGVVTFTYALNYFFRRKKLDLFASISTKAFNGVLKKNGGTLYGVAIK